MKTCPFCRAAVPDDARTCPQCGKSIDDAAPAADARGRPAAPNPQPEAAVPEAGGQGRGRLGRWPSRGRRPRARPRCRPARSVRRRGRPGPWSAPPAATIPASAGGSPPSTGGGTALRVPEIKGSGPARTGLFLHLSRGCLFLVVVVLRCSWASSTSRSTPFWACRRPQRGFGGCARRTWLRS